MSQDAPHSASTLFFVTLDDGKSYRAFQVEAPGAFIDREKVNNIQRLFDNLGREVILLCPEQESSPRGEQSNGEK